MFHFFLVYSTGMWQNRQLFRWATRFLSQANKYNTEHAAKIPFESGFVGFIFLVRLWYAAKMR